MEQISSMTDEALEDLVDKLRSEQLSRKCPEFIPGQPPCDMGREPHEEHGYTTWHHNGQGKIRVTWKPVA